MEVLKIINSAVVSYVDTKLYNSVYLLAHVCFYFNHAPWLVIPLLLTYIHTCIRLKCFHISIFQYFCC